VGEKEQDENTVSVRRHGAGDLGSISIDQFVDIIKKETSI
jgi:threonyl-tRNA synthetase